jgi:preprotein translocase subunit YajC
MKTYEDGLNEAWECAKKIEAPTVEGGLSGRELALIFKDGATLYKVFKNYSAREAVTRIKEYEEEQKKAAEIKIGDEVTDNDGWRGVVTCISPDGEYLVVTLQDGSALRWEKEHFKKTGRHFPQIAEVLKQMQEGNE